MSFMKTLFVIVAVGVISLDAGAASEGLSLGELPIRSLASLLPPLGMKPDVAVEAVTLLARPLRPQIVTVKQTLRRRHKVEAGENLSKIARRYYGSSKDWDTIYQANRGVLANPNRVQVGMVLVIP